MKNCKWDLIKGTAIIGSAFLGLSTLARIKKESENFDAENLYMNIDDTHRTIENGSENKKNFYEKYGKKLFDKSLSFAGLIVLIPVYAAISAAIYIDDPGPVLFTQKRIGKDKHFIKVHKFRSMKMSAPHDVPTHQLTNPEQYITRVGKFLRKYSLDELPQIWDIFRGQMSVIGPRPALWNQADLIDERDKYGANNVLPGLTGWAQINGRDELEIVDKAKLDGTYVEHLRKGGIEGLLFDIRCFIGTIKSVLKSDGVVEGGTGELDKLCDYGYKKTFCINKTMEKRVLVTGVGSYVGKSLVSYAKKYYPNLIIDSIDMKDPNWQKYDFASYDTVFHVAGIAHVDTGCIDSEKKSEYYKINRNLAIETAKAAKQSGVKQFIFMSSMIIYGDSAPYGKKKIIDEYTSPKPSSVYGDSKWQGDIGVRRLRSEYFKVAVVRSPMIYGRGSKGNYLALSKVVKKLPVFPNIPNQRSMLYIDNLCEFLCLLILSGEDGIYFPQNGEYTKTSTMAEEIAKVNGNYIFVNKVFNPAVRLGAYFPGKVRRLINKAFGNLTYSQKLSNYEGLDYRIVDLKESIELTEALKPVLMVASVASMIDQFNIPNIRILKELGYDVDIACNFVKGNTCTEEEIKKLLKLLDEWEIDCYQIDFDRKVFNLRNNGRALRQLNNVMTGTAVPVNANRYHYVTKNNKYRFVHCHSPIGGAIGRVAAKRHKIKTIYTAHGFHFFNGAPKRNWMLYYPTEKWLSKITDVLITINQEDYTRAKNEFFARKVMYVPGIGVDTKKFSKCAIDRIKKREELNIQQDAFILLSVGELSERKNQKIVIEAIYHIKKTGNIDHLVYLIIGQGELKNDFEKLIDLYDLNAHVKLLGYRNDIDELCKTVDCFVHPSIREGFGIAPMEAMAAGLPLISADINGIRDYTEEGKTGCCVNPCSIQEMIRAIEKMRQNIEFRKTCGWHNAEIAKKFDVSKANEVMKNVYRDVVI